MATHARFIIVELFSDQWYLELKIKCILACLTTGVLLNHFLKKYNNLDFNRKQSKL